MGVELDRIHNPTSWPNCCGETGTNSFPANCICEFAIFFPPIIFWVFIHEKTIILLLFSLFFFAHICVCSCLFKGVWVVVCVWMCVHPEVDPFTLFIEGGSLNQTQFPPIWPVFLACFLCLHLWRLELEVSCNLPPPLPFPSIHTGLLTLAWQES